MLRARGTACPPRAKRETNGVGISSEASTKLRGPLHWVGTGLIKAENQFRRVKGYTAMPKLIAALENESLSQNKQPA